jgi:integrase
VGPSYALAKEVLAKKLAEAAEMKHFPSRAANSKPFSLLMDRYWELHGQYLRGNCWKNMLKEIRTALGAKKAGAITAADIQGFYNTIAVRASNSTANRHLSLIKAIFNKALAWGDFYGVNPCSRLKKGKEPAHRLRYLNADEMAALLVAAHPRLYPVLACALLTGMRRGEIMGLDWQNVDLERGNIYILQSKSGKPREVPILSKLHEVLRALGPRKRGPVFNLPYIMLRRYFAKALRDTDITEFRFHDTRHTFASHFIMRTNDLPALQNILGHSSPAMTQRYAHLSRGHLALELAAFESAIPVGNTPRPPHLAQSWHTAPEAPSPQA